jgi:hypothetical protein
LTAASSPSSSNEFYYEPSLFKFELMIARRRTHELRILMYFVLFSAPLSRRKEEGGGVGGA